MSELRWIMAIVACPATLFVLCYYLPRARIMLRAARIVLDPPPSGKLTNAQVLADRERRKRAQAVLRIVCKGGGRFAWWNRPHE